MTDLFERAWYNCPECGAEYRSEHARDCCLAQHALEVPADD
jgi:hypothetical protein